MVLHWYFIIQKNPNIYILTILIFHMAGEGMGLEPRRGVGVIGVGQKNLLNQSRGSQKRWSWKGSEV
jgi:hypothetical protein